MKCIDLHVHSTASDGTLTPTELVDYAASKEVTAFALTDHDTVAGVGEALLRGKEKNVEVIPGIELSCSYQNHELHILGFFLSYEDEALLEALDTLKKNREKRNLEMIKRFNEDNIPITLKMLQKGNPNTVITRAHFARCLMELGIVKTKDQAFRTYVGDSCPYYIKREKITPEYALSVIHNAGGIAFLAHPLLSHLSYQEIEAFVSTYKDKGLDGIEVHHSSNHALESSKLKDIALSHGLVYSGGSDFHGANKPDIEIGSGRGGLFLSPDLLEDLKLYYERKN